MQTGSASVVVTVIESGIAYNHEDLAANISINPGETPDNGIDDDGNGKVDDCRGWEFVNNDNNPNDDDDHGTHVAGTIGAVGNNAIRALVLFRRRLCGCRQWPNSTQLLVRWSLPLPFCNCAGAVG